uniref:Uncharacterized protein n=1 Tax=Rhipicephalus zambeziensis TaxID=60191 RepID=A0A224YCW8_9ACAR
MRRRGELGRRRRERRGTSRRADGVGRSARSGHRGPSVDALGCGPRVAATGSTWPLTSPVSNAFCKAPASSSASASHQRPLQASLRLSSMHHVTSSRL